MGTSDCALFFFRTQDIVPAGTKDTPVKPACQMAFAEVICTYLLTLSFTFSSLLKYSQKTGSFPSGGYTLKSA
jgi:hypothetical protein